MSLKMVPSNIFVTTFLVHTTGGWYIVSIEDVDMSLPHAVIASWLSNGIILHTLKQAFGKMSIRSVIWEGPTMTQRIQFVPEQNGFVSMGSYQRVVREVRL